jgi:hypothetical protein
MKKERKSEKKMMKGKEGGREKVGEWEEERSG